MKAHTKRRARRKSTNPFDSTDEEASSDEEFHECQERHDLLPRSAVKRSAPLDFEVVTNAEEPAAPALVFETPPGDRRSDFFSPLEAAFLRVSNDAEPGDALSPSPTDLNDPSSDDCDSSKNGVRKGRVTETHWSKLVKMTSPLVERMISREDTDGESSSLGDLSRPSLTRMGSNASFLSARSEQSSDTAYSSVGDQIGTPVSSRKSITKKSPGRRRSSTKKQKRPSVFSTSKSNPVLQRLERFPKDSEFTVDYRSPGTPWSHLIILEDLGTASSWTVLLIPYVAFVLCLILDSDAHLLVRTEGPLSAAAPCVSPNVTAGWNDAAGFSVPLVPSPTRSCSFPFSLVDGYGIMSYGGKGYTTTQEYYLSLMRNGTAFSTGHIGDVPAMSTFLRGDVSFSNLSRTVVSLVAQGKIAFSTVVSQRKTDAEWVPVSISKPSRLSVACNGPVASTWSCSAPRIIDVLFAMPGTAILTGAEIQVNVLYSYYNGPSFVDTNSIEYFTSSINDDERNENSYVLMDSPKANKTLSKTTTQDANDLISDLVMSSAYTIEHQREAYETIGIALRLLCLTVTLFFLGFWCWSLGWKGFCGVWGEVNGCCCNCFSWIMQKRSRRNSEDLPMLNRKSDGLLWWESPWLLFPERRYLLFLLLCLLLVQNPLLAFVHFNPHLYSRKSIHSAADAMIGIGVHGILMLWLCLFCGLRYHTAAVTRQRAKQQRQLLELRRTAKYIGNSDQSAYGTEDSILKYTSSYYDKFGDVDGSGFVSHLRMKHDPCGDSWPDFLLPKIFIFLLGATSVLVTAMCRFPAEGDDAATLRPKLLRRYNAIYIFSSFVQLLILCTWVFLILRNTFLTGAKLRKEPFLSTRPAQLAFRVMSASLFLGVGALAVPVFLDIINLIEKWYSGKGSAFHTFSPSVSHESAGSSILDVLLRVLFHVTERFPYSGTASSIGPGKILYATTCGLVTAFIFLPSRTFYEEEEDQSGNSVFGKTLTERIQQRRDKRSVVTLARYTHTWRVFPLPIKKAPIASDLLAGGSFLLKPDFRISYGEANGGGVVYVGAYMPVFCLEIACWLLEASWQSYYSPREFSINDWAPGRMSLENIGLQLETAIYDESTETQCIVSSNIIPQIDGDEDSIIVVAFRGTSNARNVKTDLRFSQVPLPERMMGADNRASFRVHAGYIEACEHGGWDDWMGLAPDTVLSSLHSFSPRNDGVDIEWHAAKSSPLTVVSSGARAVLGATPVARQALPCVHRGFLEAYSNIRRQLWESVLLVLQRQFAHTLSRCEDFPEGHPDLEAQLRLPKIYVTGHSLGGSLGQLFAYDLASNCELVIQIMRDSSTGSQLFSLPGVEASPLFGIKKSARNASSGETVSLGRKRFFSAGDDRDSSPTRAPEGRGGSDPENAVPAAKYESLRLQPPIAVYTYGQPRVGNRAFARLYKKKVPHTFRVVNEGDAFTTMPPFTICNGLYKHAGLEVMLDEGQTGNTLVGPTVVETLFRFTKVRTSVAAHSMERYRNCLESALSEDELQEYYRGHGSKGSFTASRPYAGEGGTGGASARNLPDWVTQVKRSNSD